MKPGEQCQNGRNKRICLCDPLRGIFNHIAADQKTVAERKWQSRLMPGKPQEPCDIGLFSDDALQLDLVEMFQQPTNEE